MDVELLIFSVFVCSLVSETIPEHREYPLYAGENKDYRRVSLGLLLVVC